METAAEDYFVRGLHPNMQVALKSMQNCVEADIHTSASDTAGIQSFVSSQGGQCIATTADNNSLVDTIADKVVKKTLQLSLNATGGNENWTNVNFLKKRSDNNRQELLNREAGRSRNRPDSQQDHQRPR